MISVRTIMKKFENGKISGHFGLVFEENSGEEIAMTKAPTTRIRIFLNPQLFLSGYKKFPRPHVSDGIRIHSSTQSSSALKFL